SCALAILHVRETQKGQVPTNVQPVCSASLLDEVAAAGQRRIVLGVDAPRSVEENVTEVLARSGEPDGAVRHRPRRAPRDQRYIVRLAGMSDSVVRAEHHAGSGEILHERLLRSG